jgi:hypothetical protein
VKKKKKMMKKKMTMMMKGGRTRGGDLAVGRAGVHHTNDVVGASDVLLGHALDVDALVLVLPDLEVRLVRCAQNRTRQQIQPLNTTRHDTHDTRHDTAQSKSGFITYAP